MIEPTWAASSIALDAVLRAEDRNLVTRRCCEIGCCSEVAPCLRASCVMLVRLVRAEEAKVEDGSEREVAAFCAATYRDAPLPPHGPLPAVTPTSPVWSPIPERPPGPPPTCRPPSPYATPCSPPVATPVHAASSACPPRMPGCPASSLAPAAAIPAPSTMATSSTDPASTRPPRWAPHAAAVQCVMHLGQKRSIPPPNLPDEYCRRAARSGTTDGPNPRVEERTW